MFKLAQITLAWTLGLFLFSSIAHGETHIEEYEKGKTWFVHIDKFPTNTDEFKALRNELATTPQGGMVAFLVAMELWSQDPDLGEACAVLALDKSLLVETFKVRKEYQRKGFKGWQIGYGEYQKYKTTDMKKDWAYAAKSYVVGTHVDDSYTLPEPPYQFIIRNHSVQKSGGDWDNTWHGFVNTSGASSAKPYYVRKNDKGLWKMYKSSSFFAGTQDPKVAVSDDL